MSIVIQKIRAIIYIGGLVVKTPYILSFNVTKKRNTVSTFSASLKIHSNDLNNFVDSEVVIFAGEEGRLKRIFTGYILNTKPSPCWDDPNYVILNISGSDALYKLQGQKYTRRQITSKHKWAVITGVQRKAPKGNQFRLANTEVLIPTDGDIKTDFQKMDKQLKISDLSKFGMNVGRGPGIPVDVEVEIVPSNNIKNSNNTE